MLSCPMHFKNYPHDTQTCNLEIESSKYQLFSISALIFSKYKRKLQFLTSLHYVLHNRGLSVICTYDNVSFPM